MFSWMGGQSCRSSCVGSDPTTDTVRFDHTQGLAETMAEQQQSTQRLEEEERERRRSEEEARERRRLELEQQRHKEEERQRREAVERQERERRAREERQRLAVEQENERLRVAEQHRQEEEEEAARVEAARREQLRIEQEERVRQEELAAWEQLQVWLKKNGYASVNAKKSKMMKGRYPLHDATTQKDAEVVRLLLRFGADAALKNTSGQTPQELAKKTKGCETVMSLFAAPSQTRMGGA